MTATKQPKVHIGSISSGTLRPEDLLEAFSDELKRLVGETELTKQADEILESDLLDFDHYADELVEELQRVLEELAPPFTYFGTLEGDGADFGFWPDHDAVQEAVQEAKANGDDDQSREAQADGYYFVPDSGLTIHVSDHGNIMVLDQQGNEIWSCV